MIFGKKQQETRKRTMIEARAKINLTLDVTGKREDGYHLVEMVMQSVDLHDDVRVTVVRGEKKPRGIVLSCSLPFLPTDERNLAYRAAELFYKETGTTLETCEIFIEKRGRSCRRLDRCGCRAARAQSAARYRPVARPPVRDRT